MAKTTRITLILVCALVLRLININQSFWLDEASQAQLSSWSLSRIWEGRDGDFHPPLFYMISHFWLKVSTSESWLRLLPVMSGLGTIYGVYLLAKELYPQLYIKIFKWEIDAATLASALLAVAPFHVYYSQEFRSYSLVGLLAVFSMYFFIKDRTFPKVLMNILLIYTHYSAAYLLVVQLILHLSLHRPLRKLIGEYLVMIVGFMPWMPHFIAQLSAGGKLESFLPGWSSMLSISPFKAFPVILFKLIAGRIDFINRYVYAVYAASVLGISFFGFSLTTKHRDLLFTWLFVPIIMLILLSLVLPQAQPFRVIYVVPALVLIFVQACHRFPKLFLTFIVYFSLVGNITYYTRPRLQREQWRQAINFLESRSSTNSVTLLKFSAPLAPFNWYAPEFPVQSAFSSHPAKPEDVSSRLVALTNAKDTVYVVDYLGEITDPTRLTDLTLQNLGFDERKTYDFPGVGFIREYYRNRETESN